MFETFLNAIIISIMVSVNSDNPFVIRDDRVYRYVGNSSDKEFHFNSLVEPEDVHNNQLDSSHQSMDSQNKFQNIPESILIEMKNIKDASDFISTFLTSDNHSNNREVYLEYLQRGSSKENSEVEVNINEERRKLTKLPKIASPAGCVPEMQTIELHPGQFDNQLYFPTCVRMARCSGCCPSRRLKCAPVSTSFEDISVIRVKYSTEENRLKFDGFKVFRIEKHDNCSCDCIQRAVDCSPNQIYSPEECRCVCPNVSKANECQNIFNKYFDYNVCQCKCKSESLCSTGLTFSHISCRCEAEVESTTNGSNDLGDTSDALGDGLGGAHRRYVLDERVDTEIVVQRTKQIDIFNGRGINPDIEDDLHRNTGS